MDLRQIRGYAAGIVAAASYGMNPLFALPLYAAGLSTGPVLLWRYILALPIIALMMIVRGQPFLIPLRQIAVISFMGLLMGFSSLALFQSYTLMAASIASTLLFVYPLMVALIMALFFREKLTVVTCVCLALALGGIGLLYKGDEGASLSVGGLFWVMSSSLAYAVYIVMINRSELNKVPTLTLTFWSLASGSLIFVVWALTGSTQIMPVSLEAWMCVFFLALFPTAVSLACTTSAVHLIGATPTAILGVFEPVTAVIIGIAVFGEKLSVREFCGLILILGAVTAVVSGDSLGRTARHLLRIRKLFPRIRHH